MKTWTLKELQLVKNIELPKKIKDYEFLFKPDVLKIIAEAKLVMCECKNTPNCYDALAFIENRLKEDSVGRNEVVSSVKSKLEDKHV